MIYWVKKILFPVRNFDFDENDLVTTVQPDPFQTVSIFWASIRSIFSCISILAKYTKIQLLKVDYYKKYLSHIQVLQKFRLGRDYVQKGRFAKQSAVENNFRILSRSTGAPNCFVQSLNGSLQLPFFDSNNKN